MIAFLCNSLFKIDINKIFILYLMLTSKFTSKIAVMNTTLWNMLLFALVFHAGSCTKAHQNTDKNVGVQLYSASSLIQDNNYVPVLNKLADMGYTWVEIAHYENGKFYGSSPENFKTAVDQTGLLLLSSHVKRSPTAEELASGDFSESLKWWKQTIRDHQAAGIKHLVIAVLPLPQTLKELESLAAYLNAVGKECQVHGIRLGYHNHTHELEKVEGNTIMLDYLIAHTDPDLVFFQLDVYWMKMANTNPEAYLKKYPGRFLMLHIKDEPAIGASGLMDFERIFANAPIGGVEYFFIELEESTGSMEDNLQQSIDFLLNSSWF